MSEAHVVTVAVDAVGGDHAPSVILDGIDAAIAADRGIRVALCGPASVVEPFASTRDAVTPVVAEDVIEMGEHPAAAVRAKKDSSIVVGCRLVKEGSADAFFSAGSTGAAMAAATLVMGRLPGVTRPAIASVIPATDSPCVLLDVGANADCRPEHLVQFAHMGSAYASTVLGLVHPRVALLNIGEEPKKGSQLAQDAYVLMAEQVPGFIGNVEGYDIVKGSADVIVTDGFTGNVALKLMEGLSKTLLAQVKEAMTSSPVYRVAAATLKPSLTRLKERIDPDTYGGAPLLGVAGVCIIGHGSSSTKAVASALRVSAQAVRGDLTGLISASITKQDS